jgi:hypothetical protein
MSQGEYSTIAGIYSPTGYAKLSPSALKLLVAFTRWRQVAISRSNFYHWLLYRLELPHSSHRNSTSRDVFPVFGAVPRPKRSVGSQFKVGPLIDRD